MMKYVVNIFKNPAIILAYTEKLLKIILYVVLVRSRIPSLHIFEGYNNHKINKFKLLYYFVAMNFIEGWLTRDAAHLFVFLDCLQKEEGIKGDLFEIGVHHGRSAILLGLMAKCDSETLGLCDVFSKQEYNISHSGGGDKSILLSNLKSFFKDIDYIHIYEKPSGKLRSEECGKCRFFHIDGGHTVEETFNDLCIAADSIIDRGVVVIDDFCNVSYPEVVEGVFKFVSDKGSLVPLLLGFNKLVLCKPAAHSWYFQNISSDLSKGTIQGLRVNIKEDKLLSYKVKILTRN